MTDINQQNFIYDDFDALGKGVAGLISQWAAQAVSRSGQFHLVLSGGSTPADTYRNLAQNHDQPDWAKTHVWFSDERCAPPDDPASNFRMASETLLNHIDIPPQHIHRVHCEHTPQQAANEYDETLRRHAAPGELAPRFDLVLLGIGDDGHTASLFPDTAILAVDDRAAAPVYVEKLESWRVSLTYPVLNAARRVLFLVAGEKKAGIVSELMRGDSAPTYPASRIRPQSGELIWCMDKAAAKRLPEDVPRLRR